MIKSIFLFVFSWQLIAAPLQLDFEEFNFGNAAVNNQVNSAIRAAVTRLQNEFNSKLPDADQSTYLKGMANSAVLSGKGIGSDYANDFDIFMVGLGVGVGADLGENKLSDVTGGDVEGNQLRGIGASLGFIAGINLAQFNFAPLLGLIDLNRMSLFVNFFSKNLNGDIEDNISGETQSYGIHLKYKLVDPVTYFGWGLARWGGVDFHIGYEYTKLNLAISENFSNTETETISSGGVNGVVTANLDSRATVGADIAVHSIPIELSTNFQIAYLLTPFIGIGGDFNFGSARSILDAPSDGTITVDANNGAITGTTPMTALLDLGETGRPATFIPRAFGGVQINLLPIKVFAQLDRRIGRNQYAMSAGLRFAW